MGLFAGSSPLAFVSYTFEQYARRLIGGVLGNEPALESSFQYGLPQPCGALQVGLHLGFDLLNN